MDTYIIDKINELIATSSCCAEAKAAAQAYLAAVGTERQAEEAKKFIKELEEDIEPIDDLLAFAGSDTAVKYFGAEGQKKFLAHAEELKASGAKYCDCPACSTVAAILAKKELL